MRWAYSRESRGGGLLARVEWVGRALSRTLPLTRYGLSLFSFEFVWYVCIASRCEGPEARCLVWLMKAFSVLMAHVRVLRVTRHRMEASVWCFLGACVLCKAMGVRCLVAAWTTVCTVWMPLPSFLRPSSDDDASDDEDATPAKYGGGHDVLRHECANVVWMLRVASGGAMWASIALRVVSRGAISRDAFGDILVHMHRVAFDRWKQRPSGLRRQLASVLVPVATALELKRLMDRVGLYV